MSERYESYQRLSFERPEDGVLKVTMKSLLKLGVMDALMHKEVAQVWRDIDDDERTNVVIFTGEGRSYSAGGDLEHERKVCDDYALRMQAMKEARDLVVNMLDCRKPIVSAARGWAVGAGLATLLLADISIASKDAQITDGHLKIGVAAGDHAAIIWPLLCGMAKAKYYLLTADALTGEEAERINLITMALPDEEVESKALQIASRLNRGAPAAQRWTKMMLNHWIKQAMPIFDASLALEFIGFAGPEGKEGIDAFLEKRKAQFNPESPF